MSPAPIDQAQRERALSTSDSFAVSAPAGSGKTGLLTQRVLALLALCEEPENLLAITFTKKAAGEMQARILDALREAEAQTTEPEEDYLKTTWRLARKVLVRNEEQQWQLFLCPNRLRITTIDSLCRSISQQMPFESKLGHTPEILDNPAQAYEIAARETLAYVNYQNDLQPHLVRLIKHFDNRLDRIEALLIQLLAKRDQWLGLVFQTKDQRQLLEVMLVEVIEEQLANTQEQLAPISSELVIMADHAAQHVTSASPIHACLGIADLPEASPHSIDQWLGLTELLLTKQGELRKSATKAIGFIAPSDKSLSKDQQAEAKAAKQRMGELFALCRELPSLAEQLHSLRDLPSPEYKESQWQLLDSLSHVLVSLAQNLSLAFQQLGKTDYLAVTLAALDALGEPDQPSDLALALDYKIQHILVDEFQDTSTTQLELLQRLTAGWQAGDGRTLFIVGDAMQSCYRFRDANVGIFLTAREQGIGDIALEALDLQVNFRSQQGVVDWVNASFSHIFPAYDDSNRGAVSYSPSHSFNPPLDIAAVESHLIAYSDSPSNHRAEEARRVVELIQKNQHHSPDDSIAVLVRTKAHAQTIISALSEANIAYQATDIDRLDRCMPVLDCLSLTKALLYPNDRLAWLAVLRAPWCGLDMHDLYAVANYGSEKKPRPLLLDNLQQTDLGLSKNGALKLRRFSQLISQTLAEQKRHRLRHWIESLWLSLGGPALLVNDEDKDNLDTFFKLLERYERGGTIPEWDDLEKAVNELYAKPSSHEASRLHPVQVMTIHKSKGLEFDTVIIPALEKKPRGNDKELITWLERVAYSPTTHQQQRQLLISPVNATGEDKDPIYHFISLQHAQKEQLESDRVLYVGCTRAIKQLHLIGYVKIDDNSDDTALGFEQLKEPSRQSLLYRLWPSISQSLPEHRHIISADENSFGDGDKNQALSHPNKILSLSCQWQAPKLLQDDLLEAYRGNNRLSTLEKVENTKPQTNDSLSLQSDLFSEPSTPPTPPVRQNMASPDALNQREQRYIGTIIHLALEQITQTGYQHWDKERIAKQQAIWQVQLQQKGISPQHLSQALEKVTQAVSNTLGDPNGRWLLNNAHSESHCELELWNQYGLHVIDRSFIDESNGKRVRWIIDYKSSQPEAGQSLDDFKKEQIEQYRGQLQAYRKLFPQTLPIKTALYFPMLSLLLEVEL